MATQKTIGKAPRSQTTSAVSVPGNRKIAQVYVAGSLNNTASVCVNVTYKGSDAPRPRVSLCDVVNGVPSAVLISFTGSKNDLTLSDVVTFSSTISQTSGKPYAIVIEYPDGQSIETFEWKASATSDSTRPCFTFDGTKWNQVNCLCEYVVYSDDPNLPSQLQPTSKGPVGI
jgi:hypothetical protein